MNHLNEQRQLEKMPTTKDPAYMTVDTMEDRPSRATHLTSSSTGTSISSLALMPLGKNGTGDPWILLIKKFLN